MHPTTCACVRVSVCVCTRAHVSVLLRENDHAVVTSSFSSSGLPFRDRRSTSRQLQNQEGTIVREHGGRAGQARLCHSESRAPVDDPALCPGSPGGVREAPHRPERGAGWATVTNAGQLSTGDPCEAAADCSPVRAHARGCPIS